MAERKALFACVRKPRNEFLGAAILSCCVFKEAWDMLKRKNEASSDDVSSDQLARAHGVFMLLTQCHRS